MPKTVSVESAGLVSIEDALKRLPVGRTKIYELFQDGSLETAYVGRKRYIRSDSLDRYLAKLNGREAPERYAPHSAGEALVRELEVYPPQSSEEVSIHLKFGPALRNVIAVSDILHGIAALKTEGDVTAYVDVETIAMVIRVPT